MGALDRYYHVLAAIAPRTPLVRSRLANDLLHGIPYRRLRKPRLGMFLPDPLLGWANRPGATAIHPSFEFRAKYTVDESGRRSTGGGAGPADLIVLGCSWAFGHGVDDDAVFAALLHQSGRIAVRNYACMGYGPAHAYLQLLHCVDLAEALAPGGTVLYVWVPDQLMRAWRRREWVELNAWVNPEGPSHPVFDPDTDAADGLRHAGLIGPDEAESDHPLMPGVVERTEYLVTVCLFAAMRDLAVRAGARFRVVLPPVHGGVRRIADTMAARMADAVIPFLDLRGDAPDDCFYRFDGHPTAVWHRAMAERLTAHVLTRPTATETTKDD